jgi:hypothetical protein
MGQTIVHLARDPASFCVARELGVSLLLSLKSLSAVSEGHDYLAPRPHQHPPTEGNRGEHEPWEPLP